MAQEILTIMTRKGQITVPASIRRALKIKRGDKLALSLVDDGSGAMTIRAIRSVAEATYGVAASGHPPADLARWREAFEDGVAQEAFRAASAPSVQQ